MSENVKRWYVYNGELLGPDLFDPAEDDEGLYVAVVTRDAFLRERERAEIAEDRARRAEETRENANRVSVRVELENKRLRERAEALTRSVVYAEEALALTYVMLTGAEPMWAEMPLDERCARAANEAQCAHNRIGATDTAPNAVSVPDQSWRAPC